MSTLPLPWDMVFEPISDAGIAIGQQWDGELLRVSLTNATSEPLHPREVRLTARPGWAAASGSAWLHGRYMQMDALVQPFAEPRPEGYGGDAWDDSDPARRRYISHEVVTLSLPVKPTPSLLIGSLRGDRFFLDVLLDLDATETRIDKVTLVFDIDGLVLEPGEQVTLQPIVIAQGQDPRLLIEQYADSVAAELGARVPKGPVTGWCSWYFFNNRVSETDVVANLEEMQRTGLDAGYVQVDDGYQSHTGDWLVPNAKFPSGMAALAQRIRAAGYLPGIWLAPLVLHEDSASLRDHPEMVLRSSDGPVLFLDTWLGRCAVLDCSHPAAQAWLRETVRTVVEDWGYAYLKLDALSFAAQPASSVRYHAPGTTAAANLRLGLEVIREAAGDETFILGCTCHFATSIGLVDGMRVGPDVKETWADGAHPSVRHAMRMALQRTWMHGRWWANDPDCVIVRARDTALSEAETRFLATAIAGSGGSVFLGDDLPALSDTRREMALALLPPTGHAARPADPAEGPVATAWRADLGEGRALVALLNWGETARWIARDEHLRPGEVAFDTWARRMLGMGDVLLAPHEGALWQVSAPGKGPRVVGDSASLTGAGLFQRPVSGRLQVGNDLARARTVAVETRGSVVTVELAPGERCWFD